MPAEEQLASGMSTRRSTNSEGGKAGRSHASSTSATGDPHASLSLFGPRQHDDDSGLRTPAGSYVAPRASARPPTRDLADILAGASDEAPSPASTVKSPSSPTKANGGDKSHARIGSNKHFHAVRLFDESEDAATPRPPSPEKKTNPKRYNHFEFGEGEDVPSTAAEMAAEAARKSKHSSQWGFEDFVTPDVRGAKVRRQDQRTYNWSDDEVCLTALPALVTPLFNASPARAKHADKTQQADGQTSPTFRPVIHHARPDAKPHFDFVDDGTPAADRRQATTSKGRQHNSGLGLYQDHIIGEEDEESPGPAKKPLATVTNISNNARRGKDFGSQFEMTDASPSAARFAEAGDGAEAGSESGKENGGGRGRLTEDKKKVLGSLNANWGMYDASPEPEAKDNRIRTGGNGMGGRKDSERHWGFGYEGDEVEAAEQLQQLQQQHAGKVGKAKPAAEKSFWDF